MFEPIAPAYYHSGEYHDWHSGVVLADYVGEYLYWDDRGRRFLMRTWKDRQSGERALAVVRCLDN